MTDSDHGAKKTCKYICAECQEINEFSVDAEPSEICCIDCAGCIFYKVREADRIGLNIDGK